MSLGSCPCLQLSLSYYCFRFLMFICLFTDTLFLFMPSRVPSGYPRHGLSDCRVPIPAAPNASGNRRRINAADGSPESRGNRALLTARQTARQPRRAAVLVAIPMNGPPDRRIGVCCCCNRPGNRGNIRTDAAPRLRSPRTPVGAVHTLSHGASRPRGRRIPSAPLRAQRISLIRFYRSPSIWFYS